MATTISQSITLTRIKNGAPGQSPLTYDLVITPDAWVINPDGTPTKERADLRLFEIKGEQRTERTDDIGYVPIFKVVILADGTDISSSLSTPATGIRQIPTYATDGKAYKSITVNFFTRESSFTSNWVLQASKTCAIAESGMPGRVRAPLRMTEWKADPVGMAFYTGEHEDDPWTDLVWKKAGDKVLWYQCIDNNTKQSGDDPAALPSIWRAAVDFNLIATDILLAEEAVIDNLIAARVRCGDLDGNHITIEPETQDIKIFSEKDKENERIQITGEEKSLKDLLAIAPAWGLGSADAVLVEQTNGDDISPPGWTDIKTLAAPDGGKTTIKATIEAFADNAYYKKGTSSSGSQFQTPDQLQTVSVTTEIRLISADGATLYKSDSVTATSKGNVLSESGGMTSSGTIPNSSETETKNINWENVLLNAGDAKLQRRISIHYNYSGASIRGYGKISNLSGTAASSDSYHAILFANGIFLSASNTNYMRCAWSSVDGMLFDVMNNGYGIKVYNNGVWIKPDNTGPWRKLKIENNFLKIE